MSISKLVEFAEHRVRKYGAQYHTFAIFGLINYPTALIYEMYVMGTKDGVAVRLLSTMLCLVLLLKDRWPPKLQRFLPLYWYITITVSIPMLASYLTLKDGLSLKHLMNFNVGTVMLILLIDSVSFVVVEVIGVIMGACLFCVLGNSMPGLPSQENLSLFIYMFFCTVILGSLFSRNKEVYNDFMSKAKDDLNEHLEAKVRQRTIELENALAFKTEFLNNMSHEIRTPIQGFLNFAEILVSQWKTLAETKRFELATKISEDAKRLVKLVNNFLDLSKHSADKWTVHVKKFDMSKLLSEVIEECQSLYMFQKKVDIKFSSTTSFPVAADYELIGQVFRNLFGNAIKFCPKEGGELVASLEHRDDKYLHFSLRDNGIGIPEKELVEIFGEFFQSSRTNTKAGGTGLGLALCQKIIKLHHGRIWAENNNDGVGSIFHFIIPTDYDENDHPMTEPEVLTMKDEPRPKTILLIDDEENLVSSITLVLERAGYKVCGFTSATEGLSYARKNSGELDIIFLDLMMPEIDGIDVLRILKHDKKLGHLPIILQTGTSDKEELEEAMALGVSAYIEKPYLPDDIVKVMQKVLGTSS